MFESSSADLRQRNKIRVTFHLVGEDPFDADVFLALNERLLDLLNDNRSFLPVAREDGKTVMLSKDHIISVAESKKAQNDRTGAGHSAPVREVDDGADISPYSRLKVPETATAEEIKAAYKTRAMQVHPDSLASQGFDPELVQAASLVMQKLNQAYQEIMPQDGTEGS